MPVLVVGCGELFGGLTWQSALSFCRWGFCVAEGHVRCRMYLKFGDSSGRSWVVKMQAGFEGEKISGFRHFLASHMQAAAVSEQRSWQVAWQQRLSNKPLMLLGSI